MLMKVEHFEKAIEIWQKPGLSLRCNLLICRRIARQYRAWSEIDRRSLRTTERRLKRGLPFTQSQLDNAKANHQARDNMRTKGQVAIAQWLLGAGTRIEHEIGVSGICDALAVNPAHRGKIRKEMDEGRALDYIAFAAGLEDSAAHRRGQDIWKDGPLFQCYLERMLIFLDEHPEEMPDPFSPGGPLYGLPVRMVDGNGKMFTRRPGLTVHDSDGTTKVIERKPEVSRG